MYISTDLLIKIALIALAVLHILFDVILWIKLRKIKADMPTDLKTILNGAKEIGGKVLEIIEPTLPNITGLIRAITGGEKPKGTDKDNTEG